MIPAIHLLLIVLFSGLFSGLANADGSSIFPGSHDLRRHFNSPMVVQSGPDGLNAVTMNMLHPLDRMPIRKYSTTVHSGLDLQVDIKDNKQDYTALDRLISRLSGSLGRKPIRSKGDAIRLMEKMEEGLSLYGKQFISEGFSSTSCRQSVLYVALGEAFGHPIRAVMTPNHIHVRYHLSPYRYINWETSQGRVLTDQDYIRKKNIRDHTIKNGVHLKSLSKRELYGYFHDWAARAYMREADYDHAIAILTTGARLYNRQPYIYRDLAFAWSKKKQFGRALRNIDKALSLDPYNRWNRQFKETLLVSM